MIFVFAFLCVFVSSRLFSSLLVSCPCCSVVPLRRPFKASSSLLCVFSLAKSCVSANRIHRAESRKNQCHFRAEREQIATRLPVSSIAFLANSVEFANELRQRPAKHDHEWDFFGALQTNSIHVVGLTSKRIDHWQQHKATLKANYSDNKLDFCQQPTEFWSCLR